MEGGFTFPFGIPSQYLFIILAVNKVFKDLDLDRILFKPKGKAIIIDVVDNRSDDRYV